MILHLQGQGQRVSWSLEHTMLVPGMNTKEIMHCLQFELVPNRIRACIMHLLSHITHPIFCVFISMSFAELSRRATLVKASPSFRALCFCFRQNIKSLHIGFERCSDCQQRRALYLISHPSWKSCMSRTCNHKTKTLGGKPTQSVGKLAQSERMWKVVYAQVCLELLTRKKSKKPERLRKKYHGCIRKMLTQLSQSWKFEVLAYAPWFQFHFFMAI